jgi:chemotaxis protein methyltransferase CheR
VKNELTELALIIRDYCGIDFTTNLANLELKISRRLNDLGVSVEGYILNLLSNPKEWDKLVEYITINETYFFREFNQLEEFQNLLKKQTGKQINVWCIPCSTGEEAYSLAILAKELEIFTGNRVRIIASDLNKKVLDHAVKGYYPEKSLSFRRLPDNKEYLNRYFIKKENGYEVKPEIKQMVSFESFNLTDYQSYAKYDQIDFIFCRNVLFYFNEDIIKDIIKNFYKILKKDGYLFLGHAESLSGFKGGFTSIHTNNTFYYKKEESVNLVKV